MTAAERLFGVPGAENLHADVAAAYESQVEPYVDEHDRRPRIVEEWTVHPADHGVPSVAHILDWLVEVTAEDLMSDDIIEHVEAICQRPDVVAAAEALRSTLAAHITHRVADKRVAEHTITWDDDGEPLVDGERMYVRG